MIFTNEFIELAARNGKSANSFYAEILLIDAHMEETGQRQTDAEWVNKMMGGDHDK